MSVTALTRPSFESPMPASIRSSGTRRPFARQYCRAPTAMESVAQKIPSGFTGPEKSSAAFSQPDSIVNSAVAEAQDSSPAACSAAR